MPGIQATTLTNVNISDTFYGLLHAGGQNIPAASQAQIYDGNGNTTALKLGVNCNGATICGGLSATSLSLTTPVLSSILPNVTPTPAGTYTGYLTSINVTSKGIVTSVSTASTIPLPYKAYAAVNFNSTYNRTANQGTNFTIADNSYNIAQILWVNTGLYRATFTTPMTNTNYVPMLQLVAPAALSGQYPTFNSNTPTENVLVVSFKSLNFFEFYCWTDDNNRAENMIGCGILVI